MRQLATSLRGIDWPQMPNSNLAQWKRMRKVAPYFQPHSATSSAEISKEKPWVSAGEYPYPILMVNASDGAKTAGALVESRVKNHDDHKDSAPGAAGWALKNQTLRWILPYHVGVARYFQCIGKWGQKEMRH